MRTSKYETLLASLLQLPLFTAKEARDAGIPARMLAYYVQKGQIQRVNRGIYRVLEAESGVDLDWEELVLTAASIPHSVICLISALVYYNLGDQIMHEYWIAVPNSSKKPKRPHSKIVRMRNMTLGLTSVRFGAYEVKMFDRERTVIDAFRFLSHEVATKALQAYLKPQDDYRPDLGKLTAYMRLLRKDITPYLMVLTT